MCDDSKLTLPTTSGLGPRQEGEIKDEQQHQSAELLQRVLKSGMLCHKSLSITPFLRRDSRTKSVTVAAVAAGTNKTFFQHHNI